MTFELVHEIKRACDTCRFSSLERPTSDAFSLQRVRVCRWGPPVPVLIPTGPTSANVTPIQPVVAEGHWCYRHESVANSDGH